MSVGLACCPVGACRRHLVKRINYMGNRHSRHNWPSERRSIRDLLPGEWRRGRLIYVGAVLLLDLQTMIGVVFRWTKTAEEILDSLAN